MQQQKAKTEFVTQHRTSSSSIRAVGKVVDNALGAVIHGNDLVGEALAERGVIESCLYEADRAKKEDFASKCKVLGEMVLHHEGESQEAPALVSLGRTTRR